MLSILWQQKKNSFETQMGWLSLNKRKKSNLISHQTKLTKTSKFSSLQQWKKQQILQSDFKLQRISINSQIYRQTDAQIFHPEGGVLLACHVGSRWKWRENIEHADSKPRVARSAPKWRHCGQQLRHRAAVRVEFACERC